MKGTLGIKKILLIVLLIIAALALLCLAWLFKSTWCANHIWHRGVITGTVTVQIEGKTVANAVTSVNCNYDSEDSNKNAVENFKLHSTANKSVSFSGKIDEYGPLLFNVRLSEKQMQQLGLKANDLNHTFSYYHANNWEDINCDFLISYTRSHGKWSVDTKTAVTGQNDDGSKYYKNVKEAYDADSTHSKIVYLRGL